MADQGVTGGFPNENTLTDRYEAGVEKAGVRAEPHAHPWHTLVQRLKTKADMLTMGERIAYGSDSAIMREAAAEIERLRDWDRKWCEYSIDLQRIIEALCSGREIPKPETTAHHHYEMAVKFRAALPTPEPSHD